MNRWAYCLLLASLLNSPAAAQREQKSCDLSLPVFVTQKKSGQPVFELGSSAFEVSVTGEKVRVGDPKLASSKRLFLVIDASGSMAQPKQAALLKRVTHELLAKVPKDITVVSYVFAKRYQRLDNRDQVERSLEAQLTEPEPKRPLGGQTKLYDTLLVVSEKENLGLGDSVILITDGGENKSKVSSENLQKAFQQRGARLFPLLIWIEQPSTPEEQTGVQQMSDIAARTGGISFWNPQSINKNAPLLPPDFYADCLKYFLLNLNSAPSSGRVQIALVDSHGAKLKDKVVHFPEHLPACGSD